MLVLLGPGRLAVLERWLPYRGRLQCFSAMLVLLGPGRLAVLERWLPYTVTTIDRSHCSSDGPLYKIRAAEEVDLRSRIESNCQE